MEKKEGEDQLHSDSLDLLWLQKQRAINRRDRAIRDIKAIDLLIEVQKKRVRGV